MSKFHSITILFVVRIVVIDCLLYPHESETRETVSLDGLWKFNINYDGNVDVGFKERWYAQYHSKWIDMPVPSSYNDVTTDAKVRDYVGWAWYQRTFFARKHWLRDTQRIFIRFGSVHYFAVVWLNGQFLGNHSGGHLPFEFELTDYLKYNQQNLITVAVNNTLTQHTLPQGTVQVMNNTDKYPPGYIQYDYNFDFFNYAGIHRSVVLYSVPYTFIKDITVKTYIYGAIGIVTFYVEYSFMENDVSNNSSINCDTILIDGDHMVTSEAMCNGEIIVKQPKLWWPVHMSNNPGYMYTLQVKLTGSPIEDIYRLSFGFRTVEWTESSLKINGRPCYLYGFGKHEDSDIRGKGFDYPVLIRDYNLIEWIGANSYRTSHYPYAEEALAMADNKGILIIGESPAVNLDHFDAILLEKHKQVMTEMIQRDKNHPSIIMWSLSNEARTQRKEAGPHYKAVVEYVKSLDDTRAVGFVTNQEVDKDQAAPYMDVIGVNRYFSWYSDTGKLELIFHQISTEFTKWHKTFNKPIFISEYGADTVSGFHKLPSFVWTEDYQTAMLEQHFKAFDYLRKKGFFIGEMVWNFADFATKQGVIRADGNRKGIFSRQRQPKQAAYVLKSRYELLGQQDTQNKTYA